MSSFPLPAEDRSRSPRTGFTRAHWEAAADGLLAAAWRHATPRGALLQLPGGRPSMHGRASDGLEGFARSFLLAAFRLRGAGGEAEGARAARYAEGLAHGPGGAGEEAWPAIEERSQPMVEAASVALALYETRPWIWDRLAPAVQARVVDWLSGSLGKTHWPNNWLLFQVIVNRFLASVGAVHDPDEEARNLALIDSMYRRDGWYTDGPGHNYDHYVGWAIHLYTHWWARMGGEKQEPARAARYRERLARYLDDYRHLFAADGAPLHHGRSLIYRFAAVAPAFVGALADATPLAPGETRRLASGALRHFLGGDALREGLLTMGWQREFTPMAQMYSGPASPYWASKGFVGLLLPPEHPVWTATEEPLPVERSDFCRAMPEPGFLAHGTRTDGVVRVASHRSDHHPAPAGDPHYRKLFYSTHSAPELGDAADAEDLDAQITLVHGDGSLSRRTRFHRLALADRAGISAFYPGEGVVWDGAHFPIWLERVETATIACGPAQIHVHHVASFGERRVRTGAPALAGPEPLAVETWQNGCLARRSDGALSAVHGLHGFVRADVRARQDANAYGSHSATPFVESGEAVPVEGIYVALVVLGGPGTDPRAERERIAAVHVAGRRVEIERTDGERFLLQLAGPETLDETWAGVRLRGPVRYARSTPDAPPFVLTEAA